MITKLKKLLSLKNSDGSIKKRKTVLICLILILFSSIGVSFGRYIYKEIRDFYLSTKKFYFNSDKLSEKKAIYRVENWSGVGSYSLTINMNSYENNNLYSEEDINYEIEYTCSSSVTCDIEEGETNREITANTNKDSFTIVLNVPTTKIFDTGDSVDIEIKAKSTSPYKKELSAKFTLVVGQYGLAYQIEDSPNSPYLNVRITNTLDYYIVKEAFDDYAVDTHIDIETYLKLTDENKNKCASAIINLEFDPTKVSLDMTNNAYLNAINTSTTQINNYEYINKISFKIEALSSFMVKFYKSDTTLDYTYPGATSPIIKVTYS